MKLRNALSISNSFQEVHRIWFQDKVAKSELLVDGYVVDHDVLFVQINHLVEVTKKMFPDCEVARGMEKKKKASYILHAGIAWEERKLIANICKENKISGINDECTDASVSQVLAVIVNFI